MISDRVRRWARRFAEKLAGNFYEGPEPPERVAEMARAFASMNPRATKGEWLAMSQELAREAYRSGWTRGFEFAERDPEEPNPAPEELADVMSPGWRDRAHDWRWATDLPVPTELDRVPDDEAPSDDERIAALIEASRTRRD